MLHDGKPAQVGRGEVVIVARPGWREVHGELIRIAKRRAALDADEATWLTLARELGVHRELGYGSFAEYVERTLGYAPRTARERIRVAEALHTLPEIRSALARGEIGFCAARELTRVAKPEDEAAWLGKVQGKTVREIEELVAGSEPRMHRVTLELTPEAYAAWLDAKQRLQDEAGAALDDSALVTALARGTSGGTGPHHEIAVNVCPRCETASAEVAGKSIPISDAALARAECDAAHVGPDGARTVDIPAPTRRLVEHRDHNRCRVPGCCSTVDREIHHIVDRAQGGDHRAANLVLLCGAHHTAHHEGRLVIRGRAPDQLIFQHANGRPYGQLFDDARSALHNLGYSNAEAKRVVAHVQATSPPFDDLDPLIRACLRAFRTSSWSSA